ncbi:unnamed protein product [Plutella xylostella]|nr:unnamed protein product [Plutella xylostella]
MHRFLKTTRQGSLQSAFKGIKDRLLKDGARSVSSQGSGKENLFPSREDFPSRHIGPRDHDIVKMLDLLGYKSLDQLTNEAVPKTIQFKGLMNITEPLSEYELIERAREIAEKNQTWRSYIGMGYHNCCVPHTIMRNMFENPGW